MILPDVNVLIGAFREDDPNHEKCRSWLQSAVRSDEPYGMSPQALAAVVRIMTNDRIVKPPEPLENVLAFAQILLDQPHCQVVQPGDRHWGIFRDLCKRANASGGLVQDAWFAALAVENGCEWITLNRDYARFPGLRWRTPG